MSFQTTPDRTVFVHCVQFETEFRHRHETGEKNLGKLMQSANKVSGLIRDWVRVLGVSPESAR